MAETDFTAIASSSISTPAAGVVAAYVDLTALLPLWKRSDGSIQGALSNQSVSTPGAGFSSDTYLVGSGIVVPNTMFRVGTRYHCVFSVTKTGAGTATPIFIVRIGAAGTTSDAAILTFTFAVGTAVIDNGIVEIDAIFRTVGSGTSAVMQGLASIRHALAATGLTTTGASGHASLDVTSSGFNSTASNTNIGVSVNGGTSAAWTIPYVRSELISL